MKKTFLLSLVFSFLAVSVCTAAPKKGRKKKKSMQQSSMGDMKFGIQAGSSMNTVMLDEDVKAVDKTSGLDKFNPRFHAGAFGVYKFMDYLGVELDLMYAAKGRKAKFELGGIEVDRIYNLDYLVSAMTLNYYPDPNQQVGLLIGPYVGYLLSAKRIDKKDDDKEIDLIKEAENQGTELPKVDVGLVVGANYEFEIGAMIALTSHIGLKSVHETSRITNLNLNLSFGYNFAKLL